MEENMAVPLPGSGLKYRCWHEWKKEHNKQHGWGALRFITGLWNGLGGVVVKALRY
jgi:hypothetical protein